MASKITRPQTHCMDYLAFCSSQYLYPLTIDTRRSEDMVHTALSENRQSVSTSVSGVLTLCSQQWGLNLLIIITIRHELGLDRPVSVCLITSSKVFQVAFVHSVYNSGLFFFYPVIVHSFICHSQFDLYLLSFSSTVSTLNSSKISSFILLPKKGVPGSSSEKFKLD